MSRTVPTHPRALAVLLQRPGARHAVAFLATRAVNGALALAQVVVVTKAIGTAEAGRFFLLWTAAWLLCAVLRFGTDGILPRAVAEAKVLGVDAVSVRRVVLTGLAVGVAVLPFLLLALDVPIGLVELVLCLSLAATSAGIWLIASLLKAHERADLSGLAANVFWPLGSVIAPLALLGSGGSWQGMGAATLVSWLVALVASYAMASRALGARRVIALIGQGDFRVPVKSDEVGAATLTTLYEVLGWLPVILAALVSVGPEAAAGVFAATRIAGPFSWPYQAIVAVLVPRMAVGFATGDTQGLRRTLLRGSAVGALVTWPLCLGGILLAAPLLGLLDESYEQFSDVLILLIAARAVDAATGPVGEALLVGRRTWLDVRIVVVGIAAGIAIALVLHPGVGDLAIGIGSAGAFVAINLLRAAMLGRLLSGDLPPAPTVQAALRDPSAQLPGAYPASDKP